MEEVDKIIIPILTQIGCKFGDEIDSVAKFESDHVYQAAAAIIRTINKDAEYPRELPPAQAQRFRLTSSLTNDVKELGYTKEIGYQTFLYPNEQDTRNLLIWLVDKLPKTEGKEDDEAEMGAADDNLQELIANSLKEWAGKSYTPLNAALAHPPTRLVTVPLDLPFAKENAPERTEYIEKLQPFTHRQPPANVPYHPSIIEANALEVLHESEKEKLKGFEEEGEVKGDFLENLVSGAFRAALRDRNLTDLTRYTGSAQDYKSTFIRRDLFETERQRFQAQIMKEGTLQKVNVEGNVEVQHTEDTIKEQREKELAEINAKLKSLRDKFQKMSTDMETNAATVRQTEGEFITLVREVKKLEDVYKLKKRTLDLLPEAEKNLEQLGQVSVENTKRLLKFGEEWEKIRVPLVTKIRRGKQLLEQRKADVGKKIALIKRMRQEMKAKAQAIREKDVIYKQVAEELSKLPKSINRQVYIRRIMDIVKNLDKQKLDIKKVLVDVKRVQKDINQISKTSTRSFAMADEVVYQYAKTNRDDPVATQAYKNVVTMREGFTALVEKVEETGRCKNEITEMQSRIEAMEARNTNLTMERVQKDLEQVKKENKQLATKIRGIKAKAGGSKSPKGKDEEDE